MKPVLLGIMCFLAAAPARADLARVVDDHVLPGYTAFAAETAALRDAAAADCAIDAVRPGWNAVFDAWMGVSHLRFGPGEQDGAIVFWPDGRGSTPKVLRSLIASDDPVIETPEGVEKLSIAARGLFALEFLLYAPEFSEETAYSCALIRALTANLAEQAEGFLTGWRANYADTLRMAGGPANAVYLSEREGHQAVFTALVSELEFIADVRLARPLGTIKRPRPKRAEAWRSERAQRNVILALKSLVELQAALVDVPTPATDAAFARTIALAEDLDDPAFAGVADPASRLKVESLQQHVYALRDTLIAEIGAALGVVAGFNAADGD
jgi:hypothetical protein